MHWLQTRSASIPTPPDRAPARPFYRRVGWFPYPATPGPRPTPRIASRATLLLGAVTLTLATACAGSSMGAKAPAKVIVPRGGPPAGWSATPTPIRTPTTATATPASTVPAAGVTPPAGGLCPTSQLAVRSAGGEGAAGSTYENLVLTNIGTTSCAVRGFPGVSYLDAAGRQVGAAAVRSGPAGSTVRLAPGALATATLRTVHPGIQEGCTEPGQSTPVAALRIFPPANTTALRLTLPGVSACSSPTVQQLSVAAFTR